MGSHNVYRNVQSAEEVLHRNGDHRAIRLGGRLRKTDVWPTVSDQSEDRTARACGENVGRDNYQIPKVDLSIFNRHFVYHERPVDSTCRL